MSNFYANAKEALKRVPDFGYGGDNEQLFKTWSLGPVINFRDADALTLSNGRTILRRLEKRFVEGVDYEVISCNHWAVGWVEHLSFRVLNEFDHGSETEIFAWLTETYQYISEVYPILDENDYGLAQIELGEIEDDMISDEIGGN